MQVCVANQHLLHFHNNAVWPVQPLYITSQTIYGFMQRAATFAAWILRTWPHINPICINDKAICVTKVQNLGTPSWRILSLGANGRAISTQFVLLPPRLGLAWRYFLVPYRLFDEWIRNFISLQLNLNAMWATMN